MAKSSGGAVQLVIYGALGYGLYYYAKTGKLDSIFPGLSDAIKGIKPGEKPDEKPDGKPATCPVDGLHYIKEVTTYPVPGGPLFDTWYTVVWRGQETSSFRKRADALDYYDTLCKTQIY